MSSPVESVLISDAIRTAARLFTERGISAALVKDGNGRTAGMITKTDIVRYEDERTDTNVVEADRDSETSAQPSGVHVIEEEDTVEQWMTPAIFSVPAEASLQLVAKLMVKYGTHHMLVQGRDEDDIIGIVSSFDLLRTIAKE